MKTYAFDVIIIGAGPAGVTAAGALAGSGLSVAMIEAGVYAGAENWSGCVYFTESLAAPDCFGLEAVAAAPYERQVVRRGTLIHNGLDEVGVTLTDPTAFQNCYTVLRPVYDPYFAALARAKGTVLLTETTVTTLIRKNNRVVGVQTDRGPLYADIVFIAEGDASHLVRAEGMERIANPHYLQGVKAVLSLPPDEIEKRFSLDPGKGAAFEILVRNPSIAGRTSRLNVGGFLYTNRNSLSIGYVLPLDNLKKQYHGGHDQLLEWFRALPYINDLARDAKLTAYGAKIIRSGGWSERPVLVENGLVVGGASMGLGVDLPFPNFTGPASATGLYFARAIKSLLKDGKPLDAKNLTRAYLAPLQDSVYGRNAQYLSRWPNYFGKSSVLFGHTADLVCGTARFLSRKSLAETGRFLRNHVLTLRGLFESIKDKLSAVSSLRLWMPIIKTIFHPATWLAWVANTVPGKAEKNGKLKIILNVDSRKIDASQLPWPIGSLSERISPALSRAISIVYANDAVPIQKKMSYAVRIMMRSLSLADMIILPAFGITLFLVALGSAIQDAFRYYVLKTPVETMLAEPVMAYKEALRKARDLDSVKPAVSFDAKLAMITYHPGKECHIRTFWPDSRVRHGDMSQASLWWVCPARVYQYDALLTGRGAVTVNYENCVKCESCWRAEPGFALWGRFTDHRLIYRPQSDAIPQLLASLSAAGDRVMPPKALLMIDDKASYLTDGVIHSLRSALSAAAAFRDAVSNLPRSADLGRRAWPAALGTRLRENLEKLEIVLRNNGHQGISYRVQSERKDIELKIGEGRLFHAFSAVARLERMFLSWDINIHVRATRGRRVNVPSETASVIFPDRIIKKWEEEPMPDDGARKFKAFILDHHLIDLSTIRALSQISPALGLISAYQLRSIRIMKKAGQEPSAGICAVKSDGLEIRETDGGTVINGVLHLVPTTATHSFLIVAKKKGYIVSVASAGLSIHRTPAIGFRAAGLADISFDCIVDQENIIDVKDEPGDDHSAYLAIALGAGDYLCKRAKEHAIGRVQFPGQMLDTEGRDGIAKLGSVKAMVARTEMWRMVLEMLHETMSADRTIGVFEQGGPDELAGLLSSTIAAIAFGPESNCMAYDAGQVFGGFAYSEDDLLSRFYRDSSLYPFISPGHGSAKAFGKAIAGYDVEKLLVSELGSIDTISSAPLYPLVMRWNDLIQKFNSLPVTADPALAGEAAAILVAARGLLVRTEKGLDSGQSMEAETGAAEVLLGIAEDSIARTFSSLSEITVPPGAVFPIAPHGDPVTLDMDYETFCSAPGQSHRSGAFLISAFDRSLRYVPEMQLHDDGLRSRWSELADWFKKHCSNKEYDGLHFERYVEKMHRLPDELVEAVKRNHWLATYIPKAEDGLGWRKAEYYILNSAGGSFGDAGVCLLIMASTSIGTTPILLGLEEELLRVKEELEPLVRDSGRLNEIGSRLGGIIASFRNPNPGWIKKEYESLMELVDSRVRHTRVVKYLSANFLRAFYGAGIAGRRGDFNGFMSNLAKAGELFNKVMPDVRAGFDELPRRERCHRFYLRTLGHGGVSAFALTEPTAGSDSGGVKTTAHIRSSTLTALPDGRYSFLIDSDDSKSVRYLIDADRIEFSGQDMVYRTPDKGTSNIEYDQYNYSTDEGVRYYRYQGAVCVFHDIGQVRLPTNGPLYEYYTLTGAKMWITNGSIATQFCLYAQTAEGVTGFMVDRHAEGLKVGADEFKTGQRGSPTNEISLDSVRVPREAVIGYEGHGQVNALETLNVGRCGLAVVSGAIARKVMDEAHRIIPESRERDQLLGEAAAIMFGSESLAYYLIGLFDRPHESVRMESAIAKFVCSEDLHEIIALLERAYGPEGLTEKYLLEKARRDARILNIYEGTNEVQRFLILKDLIAMAADWPILSERPTGKPEDRAALTLVRLKNRLRSQVKEATALLGDTCWMDAMLQPGLFLLAETAGEILRLECVYFRKEWLDSREHLLGSDYVDPLKIAAKRSAERTLARLEHLLQKYERAWQIIKNDLSLPEVQTADAVMDKPVKRDSPCSPTTEIISGPMRVLCILRPMADLSPDPGLEDGAIQEIVWKTNALDRSGLDQALALKAASSGKVIVDVLMPAGKEHEQILRNTAGVADNIYRLDASAEQRSEIANAVQELELSGKYDLIVIGLRSENNDSCLADFLSGCLKRPYHSVDAILAKQEAGPTDTGIIGITSTSPAVNRSISALVGSAFKKITVINPKKGVSPVLPKYIRPAGSGAAAKTITTVKETAGYIRAYASSVKTAISDAYQGGVTRGQLPNENAVWAFIEPAGGKANVAALRGCRIAADRFHRQAYSLVAAPGKEWPGLLGLAKANGMDASFCMDTGTGILSKLGMVDVILSLAGAQDRPMIFAGARWEGAFGTLAGAHDSSGKTVQLLADINAIQNNRDGGLVLSSTVYEGKLIRQDSLGDMSAYITMADDAELSAPAVKPLFAALSVDMQFNPDWIAPLPPRVEQTLSRAEVIIDLGYGIKDKAGFELAKELKTTMEKLGLMPMFGATRKVTQDLKLIGLDAQIGQTGVRVNPKLMICLGISGAPQHIDYIGSRVEVFCFNKDIEAPLMKMGGTTSALRVNPIAGDLFVTVRQLIDELSL